MATAGSPLSQAIIASPLVDPKSGRLTTAGVQWVQTVGRIVGTAFNQQAQLQGPIAPTAVLSVRGVPLATILANISNASVVQAAGIDFTLPYLNKNINNIPDAGPNFPLTGGAEAFEAFIASLPGPGQVLVYNGTQWIPTTLAAGGVTQIVAGTNITILPVGGTGAVTINGAAAGTSYIKGTVTVNGGGALSGTFRGTGAVAGATTAMAAIASAPSLISLCTTNPVNVAADVVSANTVEVQVTLPNIGVGWNNITFQVVVFP